MNRYKSLNHLAVIAVFVIMLFSSVLTSLILLVLYTLGMLPLILLTPLLNPLFTLIISLLIGTSVTILAGERFLTPLNQVIQATERVSAGDFSVRVNEMNGTSEVADLLKGFNHMVEELGSIEMFRRDFINTFSHEIKTPISSISGFAQQLKDENLPQEKRREYIGIIMDESERLITMSSNILRLTDYENQQILSDQREYDLAEQLRRSMIFLEKDWNIKQITLDLNLPPVMINANEDMLSHLWLNLLGNAIKYSNPGGSLSVMCGESEKTIVVRIADNGIGMDEDVMGHIFEKFYQADSSRKTRGNGLGLSIAKRIVELHGGTMSVASKPGSGSVFTVCLPNLQSSRPRVSSRTP